MKYQVDIYRTVGWKTVKIGEHEVDEHISENILTAKLPTLGMCQDVLQDVCSKIPDSFGYIVYLEEE